MSLNEFEAKVSAAFAAAGFRYGGADLSVAKENAVDSENDGDIIYCMRMSAINEAEELGCDELVWAIEKI